MGGRNSGLSLAPPPLPQPGDQLLSSVADDGVDDASDDQNRHQHRNDDHHHLHPLVLPALLLLQRVGLLLEHPALQTERGRGVKCETLSGWRHMIQLPYRLINHSLISGDFPEPKIHRQMCKIHTFLH